MSETPQQYWLRHIEAQRDSGLNIKAYARREDLSVGNFYHWRSQLGMTRGSKALSLSRAGFTQATVLVPEAAPSRNVPHNHDIRQASATPVCRLTLAAGIHLEMATLPSPQWLAGLIEACGKER